jgi:hypothetical protein
MSWNKEIDLFLTFIKEKNYSTKNVELAMWVWVVWGKCGKELCRKNVENNNMGKLWKICEKNSVQKNIVRKVWEKNVENNNMENCGKFVKRIVWKRIL